MIPLKLGTISTRTSLREALKCSSPGFGLGFEGGLLRGFALDFGVGRVSAPLLAVSSSSVPSPRRGASLDPHVTQTGSSTALADWAGFGHRADAGFFASITWSVVGSVSPLKHVGFTARMQPTAARAVALLQYL